MNIIDGTATHTDTLPSGLTLSNIQNIILYTSGNAGNATAGGGGSVAAQFNTVGTGATQLNITSNASLGDNIRAAATTNVTETYNGTGGAADFISVRGGNAVTVTDNGSGLGVVVGGIASATSTAATAAGATAATAPAGAVVVHENGTGAAVVYVEGGTTVNVTTSSTGLVTLGNIVAPTGAVTVLDTGGTGIITVAGGASANITSTATATDPVNVSGVTGATTVNVSGLTAAAASYVTGGTGATFNTTGGNNVTLGATAAGTGIVPIAGNAIITDTNSGVNADILTVYATGTANVTTTADSAAILVGTTAPANDPTGAVTIVNQTVAGSSTYYGTGTVNVFTNGATTVSVTGGAAGGGSAIIDEGAVTKTLTTATITGFQGAMGITSTKLANVTIANSVKLTPLNTAFTATAVTDTNSTPNHTVALALSGDTNTSTSFADTNAKNINVTASGTTANNIALTDGTSTTQNYTFSNTSTGALTLTGLADTSATTATVTVLAGSASAGAVNLGNLSGATVLGVGTILGTAASTLATINASAALNNVTVTIEGTQGFTGGSGANTVTVDSGAPINTTIYGGSGSNNTLIATSAGGNYATGFGGSISGFQNLELKGAGVTGTFPAGSTFSNLLVSGLTQTSGNSVTFSNVAGTATLGVLDQAATSKAVFTLATDDSASAGGFVVTINGVSHTILATGVTASSTVTWKPFTGTTGTLSSETIGGVTVTFASGGTTRVYTAVEVAQVANGGTAVAGLAVTGEGATYSVAQSGTGAGGTSVFTDVTVDTVTGGLAGTGTTAGAGVAPTAADISVGVDGHAADAASIAAAFTGAGALPGVTVTSNGTNTITVLGAATLTDTTSGTSTITDGTTLSGVITENLSTAAAAATGNTLALTVNTATGAAGVVSVIQEANNQTISINSVKDTGNDLNTVTIADGTLTAAANQATAINVTGAGKLTLTYSMDGASTPAADALVTINANGSSGAVDVTGVVGAVAGMTITGGTGMLTAFGSGLATGESAVSYVASVDSITTGSGGGTITIGYGGAGGNAGSETINLGLSTAKVDTITTGADTTYGDRATINGFTVTSSGTTSDVLAFAAGKTVVATNAVAAATVGSDTYTLSNGVITFAGGDSVAQQILDARAIVDAATANHVATFFASGNTYVVASGGTNTAAYDDVLTLTGVSGVAQLGGTTAATGNLISASITGATATANSTAGAVTVNDTGYAIQAFSGATSGTHTFNNLAASATVTSSSTGTFSLTTTQLGTAGQESMTLGLSAGQTLTTATFTGDNVLTINGTSGAEVITTLVDPGNTLATLNIADTATSVTVGAITDTALTTINVSGSGQTILGSGTALSQAGLTVAFASTAGATSAVTLSGANDVVTVANANTGTITDTGNGLTFTDSNATAGTIHTILASGTGNNITIAATNTAANLITVGANSTVTLGTAAASGHNVITISGDVTGALSSGAYTHTTIANATDSAANGTHIVFFAAQGTSESVTAAAINVASATSLANALDIAAAAEVVANSGGSGPSISATSHSYDWFQYGGNDYIVAHTGAAAGTALSATDVVVEVVGLVNLAPQIAVISAGLNL